MSIFERRYKALRILSQLPDAAHGSIMTKLGGGAPYDDPANFDAFADKLADLFDIGALRDNPPGCVYVGPGEGVVVTPNEGHPTPTAWFSINKNARGKFDAYVNGQVLASSFNTSSEAHEAAVKALGAYGRNITGGRHASGVDYWVYEVGEHPTPERAWFSIRKDGRDRYDVHVNGQLLGSGPFRSSGEAYAAGVKALGVNGDRVDLLPSRDGRTGYWEYEVQS